LRRLEMKNKRQKTQLVLLIFFSLVLFVQSSHQLGFARKDAYIEENEIIFGQGGDEELKLNLARPARGRGPFPALVFIHGGGWRDGVRAAYTIDIRKAAERGYVAVTVDYRLISVRESGKVKYPFPAQVHDVKCAVRWLRANANRYKIDPNRIGVLGHSAGGHLSLMVGLTDPTDGLEGEGGNMQYSSRVQAVVNLAGFTDLISHTAHAKYSFIDLLGGTIQEVPKQYEKASPISFVSIDDPPVLTIHGDRDQSVPVEQALLLDDKMKKVGDSHTMVILKDTGHEATVDDTVWNFLDKHLKVE
jgi:acetyl esterase/lipase